MKTFEEYISELEEPVEEGIKSSVIGTIGAAAAIAGIGAGAAYQMGPYDDPFSNQKSAHVRQIKQEKPSIISRHDIPVIKSNSFKKTINPVPSKTAPSIYSPEKLQKTKASQLVRSTVIEKARDIIKKFEGFNSSRHWDVNGHAIGYGFHGHDIPGGEVPESMTRAQADVILDNNLQGKYSVAIKKHVMVPLNDNQQAALISFIYNVGPGAFKKSSLLKKLNQSDYKGAAEVFLKYDKVKGEVWPGLTKRRQAERQLFLSGRYKI